MTPTSTLGFSPPTGRGRWAAAALLVFALGLPGKLGAAPTDDLESRVDTCLSSYRDLAMFDGTVLVARGDETRLVKGYGLASREQEVPNGPDTRFRIASLSKPFTAFAIGRLMDRGLLQPDTPLARFLPDFPSADRITIEHLLRHRSGVVHINGLPDYRREMKFHHELDEMVDWLRSRPLDFEPGADRSYSNGGYLLLAAVLERATGLSYREVIAREVAEPLGLTDTEHETHDLVFPRLARGYQPGLAVGERAPSIYVEPSIKTGGGSLISSVGDVGRFARALHRSDALSPEAWEAVLPLESSREFSGRAPGYGSGLRIDPETGTTAVVLANNYASTPWTIAGALLELAGGEPCPLRSWTVADPPPSSGPTGRFQWPEPWGTVIEIRSEDGSWIYDELDRGDRVALVPLASGEWLVPMYETRCRLDPEADEPSSAGLLCAAAWSDEPVRLKRLP